MNHLWEEKKRKKFIKLGIFFVIIVYFGCGFSYVFELPLDYNTRKSYYYLIGRHWYFW